MKREFPEQQHHPNLLHKFHPGVSAPSFEEADSPHRGTAFLPPDGASIEVVRRPRGRPPGSKNKPKPPVVITRDAPPSSSSCSEPPMTPYVLELPPGADLVAATAAFCRRRGTGLCVLSGSGVVADVTLRQPSSTPGATVTFHGHFDVLSVSATVIPGGAALPPPANGAFTISLAGPQGQVVGGMVAGPLVAAGTVYLVAAAFNSPAFERLGAAGDGGGESPQGEESGGGGQIYSYQTSDVIWAPTARQPQPPPPPYN